MIIGVDLADRTYSEIVAECSEQVDVSSPAGDMKKSCSSAGVSPVKMFIPENDARLIMGTGLEKLHELNGKLWSVLLSWAEILHIMKIARHFSMSLL